MDQSYIIYQDAIVGNVPASNYLTEYDPTKCRGSEVCWFESLLYATYFKTPGIVTGSGIASMQFGGSGTTTGSSRFRQRHLRVDGDGEIGPSCCLHS